MVLKYLNNKRLFSDGILPAASPDKAAEYESLKLNVTGPVLSNTKLADMNAYQQKWIDVLTNANIKDWKIEARGEDIAIDMPNVTDLKLIRDNVPQTLAAISLDINLPHERLKFIFHNGYENFEYVLNPGSADLEEDND